MECHIHVIITAGGLPNNDKWIRHPYFPQEVIRPVYRYRFLQEFKKLFKKGLPLLLLLTKTFELTKFSICG